MNQPLPHRTEHHAEETSLLAYHLWQQAHCPPGEDLKFWLQAEEQLFGKRAKQSATKAKKAGRASPVAKPATVSPNKALARSQPKAAKPQPRPR